jgi:hypothetical protein
MGEDRTSYRGASTDRDKAVPRKSELPQDIMTLLVQVCGAKGAAQDEAAEKLRDLMHERQIVKAVAEEDWALEALARPLIDGTDRARLACAACFRHLALDSAASTRILQSPLILTGLVSALRDGSDDTRRKAAAALGNLAWRSEASRDVIMNAGGAMHGLMQLLRFGPPQGRESALAALSNLTLNHRCTAELAGAPEALSELVGEMLTGSAKGQLRAAGILRNMAATQDNRQHLLAFPGVTPVLERLAHESKNDETRQRASKALKLLLQSNTQPSSNNLSRSTATSPRAQTSANSSPGRSDTKTSPTQGRERARASEDASGGGERGEGVKGARRALMKADNDAGGAHRHKQSPNPHRDRRKSSSPSKWASAQMPVNSFSRRATPTKGRAREAPHAPTTTAMLRTRSASSTSRPSRLAAPATEEPILRSTSGILSCLLHVMSHVPRTSSTSAILPAIRLS